MRLKRLELQGFKTFAGRSEFVFDGGITAIVGPNGSGKSNIADALRWVLGEQSYGLLRGKRTEDMLFAGSERRPQVGMAQVSLTLDNGDAWLPIDFSEVTIARRAYRSGENEYLLNGSRVRLRNILDLLARCGLAQRTYAIIGQGLIDAALALRSEERRELFEEAAGIGLYRDKREEALRKLEMTGRNLERARDLLAELGPRLKLLERQAQRAQEYGQVHADLLSLLQTWYGYRWGQAKEALLSSVHIVSERTAERDSIAETLQQAEARLAALRAESSTIRECLRGWSRERSRQMGEAETLRRELAVSAERIRQIAARQADLTNDLVALENDRQTQAEAAHRAENELARLAAELAECRSAVQRAQRELAARQAERTAVQEHLDVVRRAAQRLATDLADRQARLGQLSELREVLAQESTEAIQAVANAVEALHAAEAGRERLNAELADLERWAAVQSEDHRHQQMELAALEKALVTARQALAEAQAEERHIVERRTLLERARQEMPGYEAGTRAVIQAARRGQLRGIHGTVAELIHVPVGLERAIEAVLGPDLEAIVVDDQGAAEAIARFVKQGTGRVTVLPLSELSTFPLSDAAISPVSRSVEVDPAVRPAIESLLGRTVLTADRKQARERARELPLGARAVTPEGEVWLAGGGLITGTAGKDPAAGAGAGSLAREREWRELPQALRRAMEDRQQRAGQVADLDAQVRAQRGKLAESERSLGKLESERRTLRSRADAAAHAADRQAQQVEWRRERLAEIERERTALEQRAADFAAQLEPLGERYRTAESEIARLEVELAGLLPSEAEAQVAAAQQALALATQAHRSAREALEARLHELRSTETHIAAWERRKRDLELEAAALAPSRERAQQREAECSARLAELDAHIQPAEAQLAEVDHARAITEESAGTTRSHLHSAESALGQARFEHRRCQAELDELRRRMQDEWGPVEVESDGNVSVQPALRLEALITRLPVVTGLPEGIEDTIQQRRMQLKRIGPINPNAAADYAETEERCRFLTEQICDLEEAAHGLQAAMVELDRLTERDFKRTFDAVAVEFKSIFARLFGGGQARLILTDPDHLTTTGIDIVVRIPGRRLQPLALLSGGEKALTAAALLFGILCVAPPPFCVLDEVDAMLDEANVARFREALTTLSSHTQFIVITHNRGTVEAASTIYGISMAAEGISQALSLRLEGVKHIGEEAQVATGG